MNQKRNSFGLIYKEVSNINLIYDDNYKVILRFYKLWEKWSFVKYLRRYFLRFNDIDLRLNLSEKPKYRGRRKYGYRRFTSLDSKNNFPYSINVSIPVELRLEFYNFFIKYLKETKSRCFTKIFYFDPVDRTDYIFIETYDKFYD